MIGLGYGVKKGTVTLNKSADEVISGRQADVPAGKLLLARIGPCSRPLSVNAGAPMRAAKFRHES
jgi:hypothetical protein